MSKNSYYGQKAGFITRDLKPEPIKGLPHFDDLPPILKEVVVGDLLVAIGGYVWKVDQFTIDVRASGQGNCTVEVEIADLHIYNMPGFRQRVQVAEIPLLFKACPPAFKVLFVNNEKEEVK